MRLHKQLACVTLGVFLVVACAPGPAAQPGAGASASAPARPTRPMTMAIRTEPPTLTQKVLSSGVGTAFAVTQRMFNATLGFYDGNGNQVPYLAESLPQLNTDGWKTFPDGRMETTHHLRANLVWQDGAPLTAEDFVFASQVYRSSDIGIANVAPQSLIAEASAPDSRTLVINWKRPYPYASVLAIDMLPPLPSHILQDAFQRDPSSLVTQPFFTSEYVGAGPFRLTHWEAGAFIEGAAFEAHALGKPKIDRIKLVFIGDSNVALANLLSGDVDVSADSSIRFEEGQILTKQWAGNNGGTVIMRPSSYRGVFFQLRPAAASPKALLDVRVRRALAHGTDRAGLNEGLFNGQGVMSDVPFISPRVSFASAVDKDVTRYPFDARAAEQLMTEAGFAKAPDGYYTSPSEGHLQFDLNTLAGPYRDAEIATLASGWRQLGFDFKESLMPPALAADNQARATFPGLFSYSTGAGEYSLAGFTTTGIGTPDNRWIGPNRPGWSNAEFDRLTDAFLGTLDQPERVRLIGQMVRVMTEDLPNIPLMYELQAYAHVSAIRGPSVEADEAVLGWNVQEWDWT